MTDKLLFGLQIGSYVLAGVVVALHAIAPLTKTDKDDKVLKVLRWVESKLGYLLPKK